MTDSQRPKTGRLQQWRERRRLKRERMGDTPQAQAERRRQATEYDEEQLKRLGENSMMGGD